jgi:tRNA(Ile)-lysidine synthase
MSTRFANAIGAFAPGLPLGVAYSGGADSTALLLACALKWPGQVRAVHVHHGLQPAADDFERHCVEFCARISVPLVVRRVDARPARGESPEDVARTARYEAFKAVALEEWEQFAINNIAIAQHADDQVETLLLALTRGAGLPGLSAMPARRVRDGVIYHRPLLGVPASEIHAWLRERGAAYIDDPSNANERFTRNRIRARLLPVLEAAFPQFRETFARSAAHAAQAQQLLQEIALQDLLAVGTPPAISGLRALSRPRQANLLRYWLMAHHKVAPSSAQLHDLLDQIEACSTRGHHIHLKVATGFVRREGGRLDWYNP